MCASLTPFRRTARFYDAIYAARGKDYAAEAEWLATRARAGSTNPTTWLDVGCGTGLHLEHLQHDFDVTGLDSSPEMLAVARERLPDAPFHEADMAAFDLGQSFDVVSCLFAAIGYVVDHAAVVRAIATMAAHTTDDGVLFIEPTVRPQDLRPPRDAVDAATVAGERIVRETSAVHKDGAIEVRFVYHVGDRSIAESHRVLLLDDTVYADALAAAGFSCERDPVGPAGLGLIIGRRLR